MRFGAWLCRSLQAGSRNHMKLLEEATAKHSATPEELEQSGNLKGLKPTLRDAVIGYARWNAVYMSSSTAEKPPSWPIVKKIAAKLGELCFS